METELDSLIDEITTDAYGDEEQLGAFAQAFEDDVPVPSAATVVGEPVEVIKFDYDGNARRGLTATCRKADGTRHVVAASEVVIPLHAPGGRHLAAYRKWMGINPFPPGTKGKPVRRKFAAKGVSLGGSLDLIVLSVKQRAARCRVLGSEQTYTLRTTGLWELVPGEIARVNPSKRWTHSGTEHLSGSIVSTRLEASALGLQPLELKKAGVWDPAKHFWGDPGEPVPKWGKPIFARGARPQFEMEQVLPGWDPEDPFSDAISTSTDLRDSGQIEAARKMLMNLCEQDLRCLDAHSHLGNLLFDRLPKEAIRHYEVGVRIGELSLGSGFDGVLPWGMIDNRPFLRCMQGFGLCLWRLDRFKEAAQLFNRMLWLNPSDNQGIRFLTGDIRAKVSWEKSENL